MSKFLKLTSGIINERHIHSIFVVPNKYFIKVMSNEISGYYWMFASWGVGSVDSYNSEIEICKIKNANDYKIVSDWIDRH